MRQFNDIDPATIEKQNSVVAKYIDPNNENNKWFFLIIDNHMIIANIEYLKHKKKWLHYQIEFPKKGLPWFLETTEEKFFKNESEGGLKKGKFHDIISIDGERLKVDRAFNADGQGNTGYSFVTLDRKEYEMSKEFIFTDDLLFNQGLFQLFREIASIIATDQLEGF
ncbi:hypothetical protein MHK_000591 [Candidatus Magnetomorum sp. HK-1]|nr:hypothetical protein MHK_000591 [Candidatus Magnetomorum sp. HK-1]